MAPTHYHGWLRRPPSLGFQLPSSGPSLRSRLGLAAEAHVNTNQETQGLRRKPKWRSGKGGSAECGGAVIKHSPHFSHKGFLGNCSMICVSPNSSKRLGGPLPGLPRNCSPFRPFSPQLVTAHRIFTDFSAIPLRLSNSYCTAITLVFSPRFDFSKVSTCGSGTASSIRLDSSPH